MTISPRSVRRRPGPRRDRRIAIPLTLLAVASAIGSASAAEQRRAETASGQARSKTIVDHAVEPAGGGCRACGGAGCRHRHTAGCRDGVCEAACPVRPGTYGFYGTQWRRWPGSGVVPASREEAVTPVKPPRSEVPRADEESRGPGPSALPEPDAAEGEPGTATPPMPPEPDALEPAAVEPPGEAPAEETPTDDPAPDVFDTDRPTRPDGASLDDARPAGRVSRLFPASGDRSAQRPPASRVRPAGHVEPVGSSSSGKASRTIPRVAFDPREESRRMARQAEVNSRR